MKRITIVEDNHVIVHLLKMAFLDKGFEVMTNDTVDGLKDWVESINPDIIITDIMLPNISAKELIDLYNNLDYPKVVISSMDEEDVHYFASRVGAIASFVKPFECEKVLEFTEQFLMQSQENVN